MSAISEKIETQVWYRRKDGTVGTYAGHWEGPVRHGPSGPYQDFNCGDRNFRRFTLSRIVKVCEDGRQVYPVVKPAKRARNGRFVKAEA